MKKLIVGVLAFGIALFGVLPVKALSTDNFTISSYDVQMTLGRDSNHRSTLRAVETITAQFPDFDQNHGLEKVFVNQYDGHGTSLNLVSVTDEKGTVLPYQWSGNALRIGDANTYVHGAHTYVITYTQQDVTRYYADTNKDEFYWDVIGAEWRVPITHASLELTVDGSLPAPSALPICYRGVQGSSATCEVTLEPKNTADEQSTPVYDMSVDGIGNGQGLTIAAGFPSGTFAAYQPSLWERIVLIWVLVQVVASLLGIVVLIWIIVHWIGLTSRKKEIGTIIPEYLPPKDISVTTSAQIGGYKMAVMTAQLLDLAVRHYIKIYEVKEKTLFTPAEYEIEIVKDISDLKWEEQELLRDTFGSLPTAVGQRLNLKTLKNNTSYYMRTLNNDKDLDKLIQSSYGLKVKDEALKAWARRSALIVLIIGVVLLSPIFVVTALITFVLSLAPIKLTDTGLALKRYLEGLKLYIKVAETERIKMLQSPEGAEKVGATVDGNDSAQLVKLYERVLPYAVLFGQEKEWNQQIGKYYEATGVQPDWYVGRNGVFNALVFSSALNSFVATSNAASFYSSSSGGSGGGGFSGGGGGGGGGGGW